MNVVHLLFGFQGRINRAKFWLAALIYLLFFAVLIMLTMAVTSSAVIIFGIALAIYVAVLVSGTAVGIKRLHDRDKSGWWLLVLYGVPIAFSTFAYYALNEDGVLSTVLTYAGFAINIWALVELGCLRGTIGHNRYGADPVAPQPAPQRAVR